MECSDQQRCVQDKMRGFFLCLGVILRSPLNGDYDHRISVICYLLSVICYLLSVICYLLSVICYLLSVICVGVWNIVLPAILVISFWEACISRWVGSE